MNIKIISNDTELTATIDDDDFAEKLEEALPVESSARTWGEEVYFTLPIHDDVNDDATDVVDPGTVTYWAQGSAMAIPYGPTPASHDDECRLAAAVNILGELDGDPDQLGDISDGDPVRVERV
jgi:hypothetical protein